MTTPTLKAAIEQVEKLIAKEPDCWAAYSEVTFAAERCEQYKMCAESAQECMKEMAAKIDKLEAQRAELREWLKEWATRPVPSMYITYSTASLNECYQHVLDKLNEQEVK